MEDSMEEQITEQAQRWHAATARADCDWEQFTAWLEASPRHREAYDDIALLEERLARHRAPLLATQRAAAGPPRRRWLGLAVAASAVLAVLLGATVAWLPTREQVFVADDAARTLALDGGVTVQLAAGSQLSVSGRHGTQLRLQGSAYFDVAHDPGRELVVSAGPYVVRDIGTRFELMSAGTQMKVMVEEGQVAVVLPGRAQSVQVDAGHRLLVATDPPIAEYGAVEAGEVAGWRDGRLVFRNEPLSMVASQVARHAGVTLTVDPAIAQRRFSGVLAIGDGSRLVAQLGRIMGLREVRDGAGLRLVAADGASAER